MDIYVRVCTCMYICVHNCTYVCIYEHVYIYVSMSVSMGPYDEHGDDSRCMHTC